MKKLLLTSIAFAALVAGPATAADLARPVYRRPVVVAAPVYTWTGFYVGGNLGGVVEHASGTSDFLDTIRLIGLGNGSPTNPQSNSFSNTRFLGGVQAGYNWQFARFWVAGVEADWDWTNTGYSFCRQTDNRSAACFDNGFGFETINSKTDWLATVRGRLDVTWGNWLFYGTGGAAWGRVDTTLTLSCLGGPGCGNGANPVFASSTTSTTKAGWVAGLGAEWMWTANWSIRAEWLHIDLGSINDSLPTAGTNGPLTGTETAVWLHTERFDEFRVGVNYKFGYAAAPAVYK